MPTKLLNRNYLLLVAITFSSGLTAQLLNTALPLYMVNALGSTTSISGVLSALYTIVSCIARPVGGQLIDRLGRRSFILVGMAIFAVGCFGFGAFTTVAALVFFRVFQGVGFGLSSTAATTSAADNIPKDRLGEGLGYIGMSNALPMVIGPSIALMLISDRIYPRPFFLGGILCLISLGIGIFTQEDAQMLAAIKSKATMQKFSLRSLYERSAVPPALVMFFLSLAASCVMVYGSLFAQDRGYDNISIFFVISALGMLIVRVFISKLVDHINAYYFIIPSCFIWAFAFALLLVVDSPALFLFVGVVYGVCLGVAQTMLNTVSLRGIVAERRGAASATFLFCFDAGIGLGALFWGILIDFVGSYDSMIVAGIVSLLIASALSVAFCLRGDGKPDIEQKSHK